MSEKSCRLTAVGFMCSAACAVCRGGMQYVVLRHFVLGDQWTSLQLPLDASLVSAAPYVTEFEKTTHFAQYTILSNGPK